MVWGLHPKPGVADTQCYTDVGRHRPAPRLGGGRGAIHIQPMLQGSPLDQAEA